tara:strand:+ start:449 stop:682 length:234 start_codon:yes stop_codon:yes gene_type:complete
VTEKKIITNPDAEVDLENRKIFDISLKDRRRLRQIVKKVHMKHFPAHFITDKEADKLIESIGPATQEKLIKQYIDKL